MPGVLLTSRAPELCLLFPHIRANMELSELVPLDPDHVDYVDYGDDGADAHCADYTYYENLFMEGTLDYDAGDCPSLEHDDADRVKHDYHLDVSLVDEETEVLDFDDGAFLDLDDLLTTSPMSWSTSLRLIGT
jgi:hypothetical protein